MSVLLEPAITHLGEAEHPLDDPDRMFDPRFREGRLFARTLDLVRFFARSLARAPSGACGVAAPDGPTPMAASRSL
jgi:hypothetical protein